MKPFTAFCIGSRGIGDGAYEKAGRTVDMLVLHGIGHVGEPFFQGEPVNKVVAFLQRTSG